MQKIQSLFQRNYDEDRLVRDEVVPGSEWVLAGEGVATRKTDGTCCLVRDGKLYKRHEVKPGAARPANWEPASGLDEVTCKEQGWLPVGDGPEDRWHKEGFINSLSLVLHGPEHLARLPDGTYELLGPKIQGNPERAEIHYLERHGSEVLKDVPRDFAGLKQYLAVHDIEGIVWHHQDGRMVKIKGRDFGMKRKK